MDSEGKANGGNGAAAGTVTSREVDHVILTYDRATDRLDIGGHCNSLDLMLDILGRATRALELKWRQEEQKKFMAEMGEQKRVNDLAASIFGKR